MARNRPTRMLPPSQRHKPLGTDNPDFDKNTQVAQGLVVAWGERIHSLNQFVREKGVPGAESTLVILIHPDAVTGTMWPLAQDITTWKVVSADGVEFLGMPRGEFEDALARTLPELLEVTRSQLDVNEAIKDGYPVVVILGDVLWFGTSTNTTLAN